MKSQKKTDICVPTDADCLTRSKQPQVFELSATQERLWSLYRAQPLANGYIKRIAARLSGPLQLNALRAALLALGQRHEMLRTYFEQRGGTAVQVVHPDHQQGLRLVTGATAQDQDLQRALLQDQARGFDFSTELGWRVTVLQRTKSDNIISVMAHSLVADDFSIEVLCRDLRRLYSNAVHGRELLSGLPSIAFGYCHLLTSQQQKQHAAQHARQLDYWVKQLADSQAATFLPDPLRPTASIYKADKFDFMIESCTHTRLQQSAEAFQTTPSVLLLAAFRAAHYRMTRCENAIIGTPVAPRDVEREHLIGSFADTQCIRTIIDDGCSFGALVQQLRATIADANANQDVSLNLLTTKLFPAWTDTSRNPLVQMTFTVSEKKSMKHLCLEGLEVEPVSTPSTTGLDLEIHLYHSDERVEGTVIFSTVLFETNTIRNVVDVFLELLSQGIDKPTRPIEDLPLSIGLVELRARGFLTFEKTDYPGNSSIVDVFRQQVAAFSGAAAVQDDSQAMTYAQVDEQSERLAASLVQRQLSPETPVGVFAPRSCETIIAFLGILKANLAYLPLDMHTPISRTKAILSSIAGRKLVLVGSTLQCPNIGLEDTEFAMIADVMLEVNTHKSIRGAPPPCATSLAYIMFTSGSTGLPKGVMIEHRGVVRLARDRHSSPVSPRPRIAHISNPAFDASTWEIYTALLNGGVLVCIDHATVLDSKALSGVIARECIQSAVFCSPLHMACIFQHSTALHCVEDLFMAGDVLPSNKAIRATRLLRGKLHNAYGPTENTGCSTIYSVSPTDNFPNGVPIGRPISDSGAFVMDRYQRLVPIGVLGELVVTGDGLSRGYTDNALNFNRFIEVNIEGETVRAYRTGDQVRLRPTDGELEFFGRIDQQVKIRGHRVELSDIEYHIYRILGGDVDVIVVVEMVTPRGGEHGVLVAFTGHINASEDEEAAMAAARLLPDDLDHQLAAAVPSYMIPTTYWPVARIPFTATGKIDRRRLRDMACTKSLDELLALKPSRSRTRPPGTAVERRMAELWARILGIDIASVSTNDNFLRLGGDSLGALRLVRAAYLEGLSITVADVFQRPQLCDLALLLEADTTPGTTPAPFSLLEREEQGVSRDSIIDTCLGSFSSPVLDVLPATYFQSTCLEAPNGRCYHLFFDLPSNSMSMSDVVRVCGYVFQSVDMLRTVFVRHGTQYLQVVLSDPHAPVETRTITEDIEIESENILTQDLQDLRVLNELITRFVILETPSGRKRMSIRMSHAQYDGDSLATLARCFASCYEQQAVCHMPRFAGYVRHQQSRRGMSTAYWKSLLKHSALTKREPDFPIGAGCSELHVVEKTIEAPRALNGITPASMFLAVCAHTLSRVTLSSDVVFGLVVNGRASLPPAMQSVVGPCVNCVPVRLSFDDCPSLQESCNILQDQRATGLSHETLDFDTIVADCTSWERATTDFPFIVQYQQAAEGPDADLAGTKVCFRALAASASTDRSTIGILVQPRGTTWDVSVYGARRLYALETIQTILQTVISYVSYM